MGQSGRTMLIKRGSTAIAGARVDGMTFNNEPVDITAKSDAGVRRYLAVHGVRSVSLTSTGVVKDATLIAAAAGGTLLSAHEVEITGLGTAAGDFFITSLQIDGDQADAATYTYNVESSGAITWTAA